MRIAGTKNKLTIEIERLVSEGMGLDNAKIVARNNLNMNKVESSSNEAKPIVKQKRKSKNEIEIPTIVAGYNSTTKSAWLKSQTGSSRKFAIRAMCLMCVGGSYKEVVNCSASYCPLYKFRITG